MENIFSNHISGVNESVHPELLKDGEATELVNFVLDKSGATGKAKRRGAVRPFNSFETYADIISLFDLQDQNGSNYVFSVEADRLRKSLNGTSGWLTAKFGLTSGLKAQVVPLGEGRYLVTNGADVPFIISGSSFTSVFNLEVEAPDVQNIVVYTTNASPNALDAESYYRYVLVYVTSQGELSNVSKPFTHLETGADIVSTTLTYKGLEIQNMPISADPRVESKMLFRTEGFGEVYYLRVILDNEVTVFTDSMSDDDLDTSETITFVNAPTAAKLACLHKGRLWLGNIKRNSKNAVIAPAQVGMEIQQILEAGVPAIENGLYRWAISYVDDQNRESVLSPYKEFYVLHSGHGVTEGQCRVVLQKLPYPYKGASGVFDSSIVKSRLYRTKKGETGPYYFIKDIALGNFFVSDQTRDSNLEFEYPIGAGGTVSEDFSDTIMFSEINQLATIKDTNIIKVLSDDGGELTGMFDDGDGVLLFKRDLIGKVFTGQGSPVQWRPLRIVPNIGCNEPNAIIQAGGAVFFVHNKQVYKYSNQVEKISQKFQSTLDSVDSFRAMNYCNKEGWLILSVVIGLIDYLLVYDTKLEEWYKFSVVGINAIIEKRYGQAAGTILLGGQSRLLKYDKTASKDQINGVTETNIPCVYQSKDYSLPQGQFRPRFIRVNLQGTIAGNNASVSLGGRSKTISVSTSETNEKVSFDDMTGTTERIRKMAVRISGYIETLYGYRIETNIQRYGQ